jgi:hypothetical protein
MPQAETRYCNTKVASEAAMAASAAGAAAAAAAHAHAEIQPIEFFSAVAESPVTSVFSSCHTIERHIFDTHLRYTHDIMATQRTLCTLSL